ncbi:MAG TPA: hypothetical protein EYN79_09915 [Planctomycetes bacterium]|nr:hypothetical protein [Planctomycetota bacterium]HIN79667.1 hypothetical protein [Planctomycetota bacterium]
MILDNFPRIFQPSLWILLGVVMAIAAGSFTPSVPVLHSSLQAESLRVAAEADGGGKFQFFTFRRSTWIFNKEKHSIHFVAFPDGSEQPFVSSGTYPIDSDTFPLEHLELQLTQRTLSNYFWLINTNTGAAMYLTALRDGGFDSSELFTLER